MDMEIFTPNIVQGVPGDRFKLYERGTYPRSKDRAFSATPDGPVFRAKVLRDGCGLGCMCGAFVIPTSQHGRDVLATAKIF